ncbi:hypothetical protein AT959_10780 [Dechloromonas denitrificans]|uniref:Inner membrane protein YgaP-like transmembrane domain-containing protein n=1 Tax=Dechloromonas denitrificans TaxID=281362 RepID=A0A133XJP1_9RHOO|nr:DUF2892 domain-containing protein [Dechloromonas denitrificans]KXB31160.1 hypothetical protein AT959_10780 [Dechloromonas denitrificans]
MKSNMCNMDRIARAVLGVALIVATLTGVIGMWGWIGLIPLATAAFSFCPAYAVFGFNSNSCKACFGGKPTA